MFSEELSKNAILSEITEYIKPCSQERSLPLADFHLTSIMDYSIYLCISRILQKGSPILLCLPEALDVFISLSMIEKVYIIDVVSKLCMATDSRPVDFISYELCCEALDVSLELSTIYG
jgi:Ras-related GTP-binding protein C/D